MRTEPCSKCGGTGEQINQKEFGEEMRHKRYYKGLSLREVARRMKVTPPFVSDLELGRRNWNDHAIIAYEKALSKTTKKA